MEKVEGDPKKILSRARGCMTAAGLFFARGAEDISQTIELGLQADMKPVDIYKRCMERNPQTTACWPRRHSSYITSYTLAAA